ncbi:MAG: hypothetical protein ACLUSV_03190 [Streptococcus sp.]
MTSRLHLHRKQSQSSSSESSSQEKKVDTSAYDSIISKYQMWPTTKRMPRLILSLLPMNSQTSASTVYTVIWMVMVLMS